MKKSTFFVAAVAVIALAVASSFGALQLFHDHDDAKRFHAAWKDTFVTPGMMMQSVDAIVVARHAGVSPGRVAFSSDPEDAVPFELNHFVVERGFKGVNAGTNITIERVGGVADGETVVLDADGGPYVPGELYVLFLKRQAESEYYYVVNDEGRFGLDREQRLLSVSEGAVASALQGMSVRELGARVRSELAGRKAM